MSEKRKSKRRKPYRLTTARGRRDFVFFGWEALAALAWGCYLEHGRGVVVIKQHAGGLEPPVYPKSVTFFESAADTDEMEKEIKEYDPEHEIIVLFVVEGVDVEWGRYEWGRYRVDDANETPPMCYARLYKDDSPTEPTAISDASPEGELHLSI